MAQKTKVKELVGRGLDSYHTKALQQMDRIEKKNKEQNHKISILSNELDNDYLTKTEEGSVISLEHSKEGMVYLDELQGNTLVNYCTDGSKELTLNGDIDVEGTFVTTTEGVDNGLVDVVCKGNTLVNLLSHYYTVSSVWGTDEKKFTVDIVSGSGQAIILGKFTQPLKRGVKYTVIVNISSYSHGYPHFCFMNPENNRPTTQEITPTSVGLKKLVFTTDANMDSYYFRILTRNGVDNKYSIDRDIVILEGDWTNREVPSYFTGMKSVGQDDVNGHKIEILSENENLWRGKEIYYPNNCKIIQSSDNEVIFESVNVNQGLKVNIQRFKNKKLSLSYDMEVLSGNVLNFGGHNRHNDLGMYIDGVKVGNIYHNGYTKNYEIGRKYRIEVILDIDNNVGQNGTNHQIQDRGEIGIEPNRYTGDNPQTCRVKVSNFVLKEITNYETSTQYFQPKYNKKEILINEPLRGLPSNDNDKIVKIGGKYYIERNVNEVEINSLEGLGSVSEPLTTNNVTTSRVYIAYEVVTALLPNIRRNTGTGDIMCDKLPYKTVVPNIQQENQMAIGKTSAGVSLRLNGSNIEECESWLNNNPLKISYALATPVYEPLEIEPTLNTYNDVTHISNNSIVPCTMKIKNTGYNAIIKPSTLYTVALDTNKSGTIGINLAGAKGTTTNNVLTLTTPATLTDDSLRLYGKGIKGSKVRLLEGDKTNWIPSYFEGMKSSFEDKVQDDGSYKMEILSNNKNLVNPNMCKVDFFYDGDFTGSGDFCCIEMKVKKDMNYTINGIGFYGVYLDSNRKYIKSISFKNGGDKTHFTGEYNTTVLIRTTGKLGEMTTYKSLDDFINKVQIEEGLSKTDYILNKHNKIQFSSIEPLRGVGDIKDKFVFKDNKLMIQRNCAISTFDGNDTWNLNKIENNIYTYSVRNTKFLTKMKVDSWDNLMRNKYYMIDKCGIATTNMPKNEQLLIHNTIGDKFIWYSTPLFSTVQSVKQHLNNNPFKILYPLEEPTYEEVPFELQKIILEGYENGTLFIDTNIPPTSTVTYAGETPIVKSVKLNKTEVLNNTEDINDNIIPYLMDMDYRVVMLQLATEELEGGVSMARLFGGTYEMIKRDILSKRLTREEYGYRLADYFNAGKLTEQEVRELEDLR